MSKPSAAGAPGRHWFDAWTRDLARDVRAEDLQRLFTHDTREGTMDAVIAQMQALPTVLAPITRIRKEELN